MCTLIYACILIFIFIFKNNLRISDYLQMYNTSNILAVSVKREDILTWLHLCENHNFEIAFSQSLMFHINFLMNVSPFLFFFLLITFNNQNFDIIENYQCFLINNKCVLVAQACLTLCNPMDCNSPGSFVHGIFQARTLEWVAIPNSTGSS